MCDLCVNGYNPTYRLKELMNQSYKDFDGKSDLSYRQYADLVGVDVYEAGSHDLNENKRIDLFEHTATQFAQEELECDTPPISFVRYLADQFQMPQMQKTFLINKENDAVSSDSQHTNYFA